MQFQSFQSCQASFFSSHSVFQFGFYLRTDSCCCTRLSDYFMSLIALFDYFLLIDIDSLTFASRGSLTGWETSLLELLLNSQRKVLRVSLSPLVNQLLIQDLSFLNFSFQPTLDYSIDWRIFSYYRLDWLFSSCNWAIRLLSSDIYFRYTFFTFIYSIWLLSVDITLYRYSLWLPRESTLLDFLRFSLFSSFISWACRVISSSWDCLSYQRSFQQRASCSSSQLVRLVVIEPNQFRRFSIQIKSSPCFCSDRSSICSICSSRALPIYYVLTPSFGLSPVCILRVFLWKAVQIKVLTYYN